MAMTTKNMLPRDRVDLPAIRLLKIGLKKNRPLPAFEGRHFCCHNGLANMVDAVIYQIGLKHKDLRNKHAFPRGNVSAIALSFLTL